MGLRKYQIPRGAIRIPIPDTTQENDYSCGALSPGSCSRFRWAAAPPGTPTMLAQFSQPAMHVFNLVQKGQK
jgi:hypothetical protein